MLPRLSTAYWVSLLAVAGLGFVVIVVLLLGQKPPIPGDIKQQVSSVILAPQSSQSVVDRESAKYDAKLKLLSYNASVNGVKVVISQQPTPETFTDIPAVYDKTVASMNEYTHFDTVAGTVHLTRPKDLSGKQAAVVVSQGTLMFAKPDSDLSDDQWRRFFNSLVVVK